MDAKELMIGDWVFGLVNGQTMHDSVRYPCKVTEIFECGDIALKGESHIEEWGVDGIMYEFDGMEPIPLTNEILKKNGFKYSYRNYAVLSGENRFALRHDLPAVKNGVSLWTYGCIEFRYVHELQHFLRMIGEKEIVL